MEKSIGFINKTYKFRKKLCKSHKISADETLKPVTATVTGFKNNIRQYFTNIVTSFASENILLL